MIVHADQHRNEHGIGVAFFASKCRAGVQFAPEYNTPSAYFVLLNFGVFVLLNFGVFCPAKTSALFCPAKRNMLAKHFMIEMHGCVSTAVNDPQAIHDALHSVAELLDVKVIKTAQHLFVPHGITCLFLVSASHFALHSWPEHKFVTVDLFICRDAVPISECVEQLKKIFEPGRTEVSILECGEEY